MKSRLFVTSLFLALSYLVTAQNPYLVLTYTAEDNGTYVQLDSIKVMNRSQDCDTVLYWPDTVLVLGSNVGMHEGIIENGGLQVFQNYPNPVINQTTIKIYVPADGLVIIIITDVTGRTVYKSEQVLEQGYHSFRYIPGIKGISLFTVSTKDISKSIRILSTNSASQTSVEYTGSYHSPHNLKEEYFQQSFNFNFGNTLLYIGYADDLESGILEMPIAHDTSAFQFAYNIPCPNLATVTYEGQVYNTVQIFSQCWLKENLNVGTMISGDLEMTNNGEIEKYCFVNNQDSCIKYGGLYQWNEMMQYENQVGSQGICPIGWHVPDDEEWKVLEGVADSQYGVGDAIWEWYENRGYDAAENLKASDTWYNGGIGNDMFGFSGLPSGARNSSGNWVDIGLKSKWWTSSAINGWSAWVRGINGWFLNINHDGAHYEFGTVVRCIKD